MTTKPPSADELEKIAGWCQRMADRVIKEAESVDTTPTFVESVGEEGMLHLRAINGALQA